MVKIIYIADAEEGSFRKEVGDLLLSKGQEVLWINCSNRQELEYAVSKEEGAVVLLQEMGHPEERYEAWNIAALRDIGKVRVVSCVKRIHYGTSFMAVLYASGIMDALFEDEADAEHIAERLAVQRNRRECREYYGIHSMEEAVSVLQIIEQDTLERYIRFIDGGVNGEEMLARFREVAKKLCHMEKCCLAEMLPENVREEIGADAGLEKLHIPQSENARQKKPYLARKYNFSESQ